MKKIFSKERGEKSEVFHSSSIHDAEKEFDVTLPQPAAQTCREKIDMAERGKS